MTASLRLHHQDPAHEGPPQLIGPLLAEEAARLGGRPSVHHGVEVEDDAEGSPRKPGLVRTQAFVRAAGRTVR
ncbi:hypothetical protein [Streptomyces sp. NPDC056628]|uniref:hypothetical protein n=1 Tax=Streptomyces sp. NPDC056628 TaxID=3345882 RepID=UPI0036748D39